MILIKNRKPLRSAWNTKQGAGKQSLTWLSFMWYRKDPPYVLWSKGHPKVWITAPGWCFFSSISQTYDYNIWL